MEQAPHDFLAPRRLWRAVLLSLFGSGIGHVYAGRPGKGLVLFTLQLLPAPILLALAFARPNTWVLYVLAGLVVFNILLFVYSLLSAGRAARRAPAPFPRGPFQRVGLYLLLVLVSLGWTIGGVALVREHAFEAFKIPTGSMEPTIRLGDRVLVNKLNPLDFQRGDVVVFRSPDDPRRLFLKRVIAVEGDVIEGTAIEAGLIYVVGDNREASYDSRKFGPIPVGSVIGTAQYIFWSEDGLRADLVKREER